MRKIVTIILAFQIMFIQSMNAQSNNPDFMHSVGKIYVVVAVLVAIFIGIILFLFYLERKLSKLESQLEE